VLFTADLQRRARFEREARMLATLNHPHIAAIYGVQDADGVLALILELVEGQTLADRIASASGGDGLPIAEVVDFARQIADALDAAHEKGIVHRDLKPANVKITPEGVVKVLDFGLAKEPNPDGARTDLAVSREGMIVGTAAYMSPEQTRGQPVDRRADVWAFGCVLYEMLTGRHAFPGETISDTIAQILSGEPDWSMLPAATPPPILRLLRRCLAKSPKQRLRDIGDVRFELDGLDDDLPAPSPAAQTTVTRAPRRAWLPWMALVVLAAAVVVWEFARSQRSDAPLAGARFTRLTNWDGTEEAAEISPDGKFVAFLSDRLGEFDVWLSQIGSRHFTNLTRDLPPLAAGGSIVRKLGFSDDGADIWFNPGDGKQLLRMPMTGGGNPTPFLQIGANTPAWSPDGAHIAYVYKPDRNDPVFLADGSGADPKPLLPSGSNKRNNPVWSPDGEWIYFVSGPEPQDEIDMDIWRVKSSGGSPERLTNQHAAVSFLTVLDPHTLLYIARADDWSGPWLWSFDIENKVTRRVASGVDQYTSVAASRDGRRIVATVANPSAALWRVPLLDRPADEREAEPYPLPAPTGRTLAPRFSGRAVFYLSADGGGEGLWRVGNGEASEIWRNLDGALSEPPAISPDGRRVAVVVRRDGKRHLSIMAADGTSRQTLAPEIDVDGVAGQGTADWSPDGTRIVIGGHDAKGPALFVIPLDGHPYIRLVEGTWVNPVWSPDDGMIVFAGRSLVGQVELHAVRPGDGKTIDLPQMWVRPGGYRFLPDGKGLVYLPRIQAQDFWLLDLTTKRARALTQLRNQGSLRTFDITPDGRFLVFDRSRQNSDIVLIEPAK
jgi:Tol biopolymer transport system component